jgi:hypothetical protein
MELSFNKISNKQKYFLTIFVIFIGFLLTSFVFNLSIIFSITAFVMFILFYLLKAISLYIISSDYIKFDFLKSLKLFFISDFVEVITFSGKIGADASKIYFLKKETSTKNSLKIISLFRISVIISFVLTLLFLINQYIFFLIFILLCILGYFKKKLVISLIANIFADFVRVFLFAFLIFQFGVISNQYILIGFLGAGLLSRVINIIPHGFGISEITLGIILFNSLSAIDIATILLILRTVTVIPSTIIGGILSSKEIIKRIRKEI